MSVMLFLTGSLMAQVSATPQRPSFSTNTATTHPRWLEFELGGAVDEDRFDLPLVLKLGAVQNVEAFAAFVPVSDSDTDLDDVTIGGRLRFAEDQEAKISLAAQASVSVSDFDFGSGTVYGFLAILSKSFDTYALDLNAGLNVIDGQGDRFFEIATLSRSLSSEWSGYAEILIEHDTDFGDALAAASFGIGYAQSLRTVFDLALNVNISDAPFDVQLLGGITHSLSRLW